MSGHKPWRPGLPGPSEGTGLAQDGGKHLAGLSGAVATAPPRYRSFSHALDGVSLFRVVVFFLNHPHDSSNTTASSSPISLVIEQVGVHGVSPPFHCHSDLLCQNLYAHSYPWSGHAGGGGAVAAQTFLKAAGKLHHSKHQPLMTLRAILHRYPRSHGASVLKETSYMGQVLGDSHPAPMAHCITVFSSNILPSLSPLFATWHGSCICTAGCIVTFLCKSFEVSSGW